jgi:hypothetical protein
VKPPAEIVEEGLRAYEQAGAFERLRRRNALVFFYSLSPLGLLLLGWVVGDLGHAALAYACLAGAILSALVTVWNWRRLAARHARNLALLDRLEKKYGDDLPWLEVERHMAALERVVSELERESSGRTYLDFSPDDEGPRSGEVK